MKRPFSFRPKVPCRNGRKSGQALLESLGVIILLCLILFGVIQYVMLLTATEIIQHSANATARARAVGLNGFMVRKVNTIASIANSGSRIQPDYVTIPPENAGVWMDNYSAGDVIYDENAAERGRIWERSSRENYFFERSRFQNYLLAENYSRARGTLEYERSPYADAGDHQVSHPLYLNSGEMLGTRIQQDYPLTMPLFRLFSENNSIRISRDAWFADHADFYLE